MTATATFMKELSVTSTTAATTEEQGSSEENPRQQRVFRDLLERLPFEQALIFTTMPRGGGLQLARAMRPVEAQSRAYSGAVASHDRLSWRALTLNAPVRGTDCWPDGEYSSTPFFSEFLRPFGMYYSAAVNLAAPVLGGYPGVLLVLRSEESGDFSDSDLQTLAQFAETQAPGKAAIKDNGPVPHRLEMAHFVFDAQGHPKTGAQTLASIDSKLRTEINDRVSHAPQQLNGSEMQSDRISLPDSLGDLWNFRIAKHRRFPAISDGPVVFVGLQPECEDWSLVRPEDFAADPEVARLVPALHFMNAQYSRVPTLTEIARTVHLSPYHFHRRFTELLGITPKHYLLDCQIRQAKQLLVAKDKPLSEIAATCGFAHQSHFTSRFKQATGLTPTRWRRMATEQRSA
jgi:AraC-like DNA-binding protein